MYVAILHLRAGGAEEIRTRMEQLGVRVELSAEGPLRPLGHGSPDLIYVIPYPAFASKNWPALRVQLAHASRLFLVVGQQLRSADFMTAARDGAFDVVTREDPDERWCSALKRIQESQQLWVTLYGGAPLANEHILLGNSPAIRQLRQAIERLGPTDISVLITGESGVGKEKVASALHQAGGRNPFLAINCAAIPKDLIEAELFGAEKGAFTGALKTRRGLVEEADGGTLFLDEVGELELPMQPKLLRFLETRTARRVGGERDYRVRVRLVAATNRDLRTAVAEGRFRADLYYRLSEMVLHVPPLRERLEDVPVFVREFIQRANERFGKHIESVEPALIQRFQRYEWPGNVRELKSSVDRLVLLYDAPILREGWWEAPPSLASETTLATPLPTLGNGPTAAAPALPAMLPGRTQRVALARELLAAGNLHLAEIAARTGVHPTTLFRWRKAGKV